MNIQQQNGILRLQEAGLLVEPFGPIGPYADGYTIGKPIAIPGNVRSGWAGNAFWGDTDIPIDAPAAHLYPQNNTWIFEIWECIPGPGPGDFQRSFDSLDEAIAATLEYYFGDPTAMNPPELNERK